MEQITSVQYKAFDGKIFEHEHDCRMYERTIADSSLLNLRNFDVEFPMQSGDATCRAYFIHSENAFNMFRDFVERKYPAAFYYDKPKYAGNGWYVTEVDEANWCNIYKLSDIVQDWCALMHVIAENTMDFKDV